MSRDWCGRWVWCELVLGLPGAASADDAEEKAVAAVERLRHCHRDGKQPGSGRRVSLAGESRGRDREGTRRPPTPAHLGLRDTQVTDRGPQDLATLKHLTHLATCITR